MSRKCGFTLIELVVVLVIMGIVFSLVYQNFLVQERGMREQRQWSGLNIKARRATDYMVQELRQIGFSGRGLSPVDRFGIVYGGSDSIVYTHDLDGSASGFVETEDIHSIHKKADTLYIDGAPAVGFLDSLTFVYRDIKGNVVTNVTEVNTSGDWILPGGNLPVSIVEFTLHFQFPNSDRIVEYTDAAGIRNMRP